MKQADRRNLITTTAGLHQAGACTLGPAALYAAAVLMALSIAACASFQETPAQRAQRIDPLLSAAGFQIVQANTPKKQSIFASLPPLTMNYYVAKDGKARYWFADPYECNCVYQGDAKAYQRYQNIRLQQKLVREEEQTAELNQDAAMQMNMYDPMFFPY
ncbi:MAG TPA: hypothetical protein VN754_01575 [Candidatus Binataceae bacterium]|nr:hypothetical protein [Candidatus Binataceae bacterium]